MTVLSLAARSARSYFTAPTFSRALSTQGYGVSGSSKREGALPLQDDFPERDLIVPRFWTGTPAIAPDVYQIDCSGYDMTAPTLHKDLVNKMKQTFYDAGVVHLTNTGLTEFQDMRRWAKVIMESEMDYTGGANSRNALETNVYDTGAPKEAFLHYHHEMAYVSQSPKHIGFSCLHATEGKGATFLSDNVGATKELMKTELGQKLAEKGIIYVRNLTDREAYKDRDESEVYNHWQQSFGVEDPALVEPLAKERGLEIEWDGRFLRTQFHVSAFEYFPQLDKNLLYSSLADDGMWFDQWPGIAEVEDSKRPLNLLYGDGTEFTQEELQTYIDVYDNHGIPIWWKQGDIAVACNYRFAHGRPEYELAEGEKRELGVMLGETFDRVGQVEGKWY